MGRKTTSSMTIARSLFESLRICGFIVVLVVVFVCAAPFAAYADGDVELVKVWAGSRGIDSVMPMPTNSYNLSMVFDKNVSYSEGQDDLFVKENLSKVYVIDGSGQRVDSVVSQGASGPDDKKVIYVRATEWLSPLTQYTLVAEAGIRAKNGNSSTAVEYRVPFKTGAECSNGLTVYQNAGIAITCIVFASGAGVAFLRRRRSL